ncbi:hypothetical protein [Caballeronia sp. LZ019]|uniref:hypothetical protein n=1 Tax=Caballeronia sp. LZ019 TaxID=3038555 RepID=UPI00285C6701|nr:hypothetical protein [Caballeronia sp. LZ019]MDR5808434.1 hypothetical protein [Caballeronia sp. LZ019]
MFPKPPPQLEVVRGGGAAAEAAAGRGLATLALEIGTMTLLAVVLIAIPGNAFEEHSEEEEMRRIQAKYAPQGKLPIPDTQSQTQAQTNATNNECKAQAELRKQNGEVCENDGYTIMEDTMKYRRLIDPPKGRGLDGLFEKVPPMNLPQPLPDTVVKPKPGTLMFIPKDKAPPSPAYAFTAAATGSSIGATYPKFVVFEAKNMEQRVNTDNVESVKKAAKRRLGETCDGTQMSEPWTEERIPQALKRDSRMSPGDQARKRTEIGIERYARWIFVCLPGPFGGEPSKVFVFIDVVEANLDIDPK